MNLVIRGNNLGKSMSQYLCRRIEQHPRIELITNSEVERIDGDKAIESIGLRNNRSGERRTIECAALFVFIGAKPHTEWLGDSIRLDDKGFVLTGASLQADPLWQDKDRAPCELETTCAGRDGGRRRAGRHDQAVRICRGGRVAGHHVRTPALGPTVTASGRQAPALAATGSSL